MTTAAPTAASPLRVATRRSTLRTPLMALSLVPALAVGASWAASVVVNQAPAQRALLLQGATQTAQAFSDRILDLQEQAGQTLGDPELRAGVQTRAEDFLLGSALPVTDVVVTNSISDVVVAYDHSQAAGTGATQENTADEWRRSRAALREPVERLAQEAISRSGPVTRALSDQGLVMTAVPVAGGGGATVLVLDSGRINAGVQSNLLRSLGLLAAVTLLTLALTSTVATRLIGRLRALTEAADRISQGDMDVTVPVTGNDELTTLAQSVDRQAESLRIAMRRRKG
ncbi:HAMP domain-containing protein [Deinococcus multiflagellatus]|uniref:HAMP domain-containing protein n=1 Tax=Deinococcus multiflagellatus TaxID=1656887 RepID=A0ABW1ZT40_9DEIO|nr:HAMP domain-containing protein [Deinococcus multiflagellatus]MBZ9715810.1 HAMP domain-containing protein [Deinococcus multiflagellatus]